MSLHSVKLLAIVAAALVALLGLWAAKEVLYGAWGVLVLMRGGVRKYAHVQVHV